MMEECKKNSNKRALVWLQASASHTHTLRCRKEKQAFYWVLLGLEKETKMMHLPLCKKKKKKKNIYFPFLAQFTYIRLHFFSFSCRSHVTTSLAFLDFFSPSSLFIYLFFFLFFWSYT
jgi:hypothetical protein